MSWGNTEVSFRVRCGSPVGVGEHIKVRGGRHGNTGEPTVSTRRNAARGQPREQMTRLLRKLAAPEVMRRKVAGVKWYPYRGKPKGRRRTKAVLASS